MELQRNLNIIGGNVSEIKKYFTNIGKKGGSSGRGDSKRRSPEHYQKMVEARKRKRGKKSNK